MFPLIVENKRKININKKFTKEENTNDHQTCETMFNLPGSQKMLIKSRAIFGPPNSQRFCLHKTFGAGKCVIK